MELPTTYTTATKPRGGAGLPDRAPIGGQTFGATVIPLPSHEEQAINRWSIDQALLGYIRAGFPEEALAALAQNADPNAQTSFMSSALHLTCGHPTDYGRNLAVDENSCRKDVEFADGSMGPRAASTIVTYRLLQAGANVDAQDRRRETPLHLARSLHDFDKAKLFLRHKPNLYLKNKDGEIAMHVVATLRIDTAIVSELLKLGGVNQLSVENNNGLTPVDIVNRRSDPSAEAIKALFAAVQRAASVIQQSRSVDVAPQPSVREPVRPNNGNSREDSAFLAACREGDASEMDGQLQAGANIYATQSGFHFTGLYLAVLNARENIVRKLLSDPIGCQLLNIADTKGHTPLMAAVLKGQPVIADLLLSYGADPYARTTDGQTIVDILNNSKRPEAPLVREVLRYHGIAV